MTTNAVLTIGLSVSATELTMITPRLEVYGYGIIH